LIIGRRIIGLYNRREWVSDTTRQRDNETTRQRDNERMGIYLRISIHMHRVCL